MLPAPLRIGGGVLGRFVAGTLGDWDAIPQPSPQQLPDGHAQSLAARLAEQLGYVGVLALEFFVLSDGAFGVRVAAKMPRSTNNRSITGSLDASQR